MDILLYTMTVDNSIQPINAFKLFSGGAEMSKGIAAFAECVAYDEKSVIYKYGGYNLNEEAYRNEQRIRDGMIIISRTCFAEPEIHRKIKRLSGGRKKTIVKRIPVEIDYLPMIRDGRILIENCSHCWQCNPDGIDIIALRLLSKIFKKYQEDGAVAETILFFC